MTAVDLSLSQTRCVVIHLSMNKSRRLSAVFDGISANVPFFSSQKIIWIWKVVGCGSSAFWQRFAVLIHVRFSRRSLIVIFCEN